MQHEQFVHYYALLNLPVAAPAEDVLEQINRAREILRRGGLRAWLLSFRGFGISDAALAEAIFSDDASRRAYDEELTHRAVAARHVCPFW